MYKDEGPGPRINSSVCHHVQMQQRTTVDVVTHHLHVARMDTYMRAASGDPQLAIDLYLWNTRISGALFETLSITEVIFRNALDAALKEWNAAQAGDYSMNWTQKAARPLNSLTRSALQTARSNAAKARAKRTQDHPRKWADITHDDLVAQLTFGTYVRLLPSNHSSAHNQRQREILWDEALHQVFQGRPSNPRKAHLGRVERLHALRNRVAHAEPVLDVNFVSRVRDMVRLVESIDPVLAGWLSGTTRVHQVLRERPGP